MSKDDQPGGTSDVNSIVLDPIALARTPGVGKVFILTPEILSNLGLTGHMTQRIASLNASKTPKDSTPQEPRLNSGQQSHKPTDSISQDANKTPKANKRKRKNTNANNTKETAETSKSCISPQLEQRLNGTNEKIAAEGSKSKKSNWSTPKTKKPRRKINISESLDDQMQNKKHEHIEESKNDSNECTSGVRTSKRVVKLKRFDDFVLTDDVLSHVKKKTGCETVRRRRSSSQSKNKEPVAESPNEFDNQEIVETSSNDKIRSVEEINSSLSIDEKNQKQEQTKTLQTKSTIPSQEIRFKVPESPGNVKKKDSRKSHEILNPNENHETVESVPNIEKKSKESTETTIPDLKLLETKNTEIPEKSYIAEAHLPPNLSQTISSKEDTTKPELKLAEKKVFPQKSMPLNKAMETVSEPAISGTKNNLSSEIITDDACKTDVANKDAPKSEDELNKKPTIETTTIEITKTTISGEKVEASELKISEATNCVFAEKNSSAVLRSLSDEGMKMIPEICGKQEPEKILSREPERSKDSEMKIRSTEILEAATSILASSIDEKGLKVDSNSPMELTKDKHCEISLNLEPTEKIAEQNAEAKCKDKIETMPSKLIMPETKKTLNPGSISVASSESSELAETKFVQTHENDEPREKSPTKKIITERRKSKSGINAPTVEDKNSGKKVNSVIEKTLVVESFDASSTDSKTLPHKTKEFSAKTTINPNFTRKKDEVNSSKSKTPKISNKSKRSKVPQPTTPQNSVGKEGNVVAKPHSRRSQNKKDKNKNTKTVQSILSAEKTLISDATSNSSSLFENNEEVNISNPNSSNSFHKTEANITAETTTVFHGNTSASGLNSDSSTCENNSNKKSKSNLHRSPLMPIKVREEVEDPPTTARRSPDNDKKSEEADSDLLKTEISNPIETNTVTEVHTRAFPKTGNNCQVDNIAISSGKLSSNNEESATNEGPTPKKRGRPKKRLDLPNPMENPRPRIEEEKIIIDEKTTEFPVNCETVGEKTTRKKKPARRYVNETDGKGLSEESGDENEEEQIKPAKRRGRPPGKLVKGADGDDGQVRRKGRGRGRGRGRPRLMDAEYVPRLASAPAKNNDEKTDDRSDSQDPKNEKSTTSGGLECAKCMKQMAKTEWARHNLMEHNGMGWLTGTPKPDYENNVKLLRSVLMAMLKKRSMLICESCGMAKRSANGFISHLQFCGKTDEERRSLLVACPVCGSVMMPSSLEMHERTHRQVDKSMEQKKWEEALDASSSTRKRKAAEKAATKISEFTVGVEVGAVKKNQCPEDKLDKLVKKPPSDVPVVWKGIWNKELATNGKAFCRQPICQFTADSIEAMCEHNAVCPRAPRPKFVCKLCHFSSETEEVVTNHVREKHWDNKRDVDSASDFNLDSSSVLDTDSSSDEKRGNKLDPKPQSEKKEFDKYRPQATGIDFLDKETPVHSNWHVCYPPALRWTMKFELKNYRLRLFEKLSPRSMRLLKREKSLDYLPGLSQSMRFKLPEEDGDKKSVGWIRWRRFQGGVSKGIPTMFTGGPVWALAWLPIPAPMYDLPVDQYIAVSTHPSMESTYTIGKSYSAKNIIQIWNLGPLDHNKKTARQIPKFAYGVAHDNGTVWRLEWCPSGCYEHERFHEKTSERTPELGKDSNRMGLLAAACSDGCVHIFSLPFPEGLNRGRNENDSMDCETIYETKPVMTLAISAAVYERSEQKWQCTSLNWSKTLGHDTIIAGFSNGYVALWDPTTTSPLLVNSRGETTIIDAFHTFYAHCHAVSSVLMVTQGDGRFFYTSGYDRLTKLWDMEDLSCPVESAKRSIITAASLFANWGSCVNAGDDAYGITSSHTYFVPPRQEGTRIIPLLSAKSTIYGVATSDYGNSVAQGTLAGEVTVMFPHQLWIYKDKEREAAKKRWMASSIRIVDFRADEASGMIESGRKRKTREKEYAYNPDTYQECDDRYGIAFTDESSSNEDGHKRHMKPVITDQLSTVNLEQYPFASANQLSWNPNAWSYLWLCVGYQNGLVRLLHFHGASSVRELRNLLPPHAASMLEGSTTLSENIAKNDCADS